MMPIESKLARPPRSRTTLSSSVEAQNEAAWQNHSGGSPLVGVDHPHRPIRRKQLRSREQQEAQQMATSRTRVQPFSHQIAALTKSRSKIQHKYANHKIDATASRGL